MADVDVVRTIFKPEWLGAGAVQNMIRQFGLAEKAMQSLGGKGLGNNLGDLRGAQARLLASKQAELTKAVAEGSKSWALASTEMGVYKDKLASVAEGFPAATSGAGGLASGLGGLTVAAGAAVAGIAALAVGIKTFYDVSQQGAEVAQLDQSFRNLNTQIGASPTLLQEMKDASQGTLTTLAAQEGFMTLVAGSSEMMSRELANAAPKLLEISKAANKLNPALGDTNFMFTSLAKGVKRAEPRLIDNLGLKLRVSDANRTLAKELGKSVMALTAEEKQLAILNETLRAGDLLIEQVGGSVEGMTDPFQRMASSFADWGNEVKAAIANAGVLGGVLDAISGGAQGAADSVRALRIATELFNEGVLTQAEYDKARMGSDQDRIDAMILGMNRQAAQKLARDVGMELALETGRGIRDGWNQFNYEPLETSRPNKGTGFRMNPNDPRAMGRADQLLRETIEAGADMDKFFADTVQGWQEWADAQNEASMQAREDWLDYMGVMGDLAQSALEAERDTSFFTMAVQDIGKAWVDVNAPTGRQREIIDDLQSGYDKAKKKVEDLRSGVKGYGMDSEQMNSAMEKATGEMAYYEQQLARVNKRQEDWREITREAVWNWDNIKTSMYDAAGAADLSAQDFLRLALALGETDQASAEAALAAAGMARKRDEVLEGIRVGEIDPEEAFGMLEDFADELEAYDLSILLDPSYDVLPPPRQQAVADMIGGENFDLGAGEFVVDSKWKEKDDLTRLILGEESIEPKTMEVMLEADPELRELKVWSETNTTKTVYVDVVVNDPEDMGGDDTQPPESPGAGGRAAGGNAIAQMPIKVGEHGVEYIVPPTNSTVIPNDRLGGGVNMHFNITVQGSVGTPDLASVIEDHMMETLQQYGVV